MQIMDFAECCTAKILYDLQGTERDVTFDSLGSRKDTSTYENYRDNYAIPELVRALKKKEEYEKRYRNEYNGDLTNLALVFATTNAYQVHAFKFLREVGFRNTRKEAKGAHPERELYGHFASGECLQNWLNDNRDKG